MTDLDLQLESREARFDRACSRASAAIASAATERAYATCTARPVAPPEGEAIDALTTDVRRLRDMADADRQRWSAARGVRR